MAIGGERRTIGFGLAGCRVVVADDVEAVRRAWAALRTEQVDLLLLTPLAADALATDLASDDAPLFTVMPE